MFLSVCMFRQADDRNINTHVLTDRQTDRQTHTHTIYILKASKAFDTVWHAGLFSKLHDFGIRGKALRIIMNSYEGMSSYVQVNGMKSSPFQVIQGVRQGGVTSTWYYLLYIDDLLRELDSLEGGCTIGSLRTSNPTLADDFLYSSLTKTGAEKGLKVADNHANRWHYTHHPAKCKLLVFSLLRTPSNATVKLGTSTISQAESVSHVGIEIHKSFKSSAAINARIAKGRSSLFSILSIDRETSLINPITIASLFGLRIVVCQTVRPQIRPSVSVVGLIWVQCV